MAPEGWQYTTLGALYEFRNGVNADGASYGFGTKFANIMEILRYEYLTAEHIPGQVQVSESTRHSYEVRYGDVLFNRTSETFDEVGFSSVYLDSEPVIFGGFVIRGRPISDAVYPPFAKYYLRQSAVRREIIRRGQGAVRANIGQADLSEVALCLPPLPEQKKIAEILSTWDRAIETTGKLLANAEAQKRALMQQLLTGERRLPGFKGREWREVRLGDVGKISSAGVDKKVSPNEPQVRLLNFLDVFRREFIFDAELDHVVTSPASKVKQCDVRKGDVFFTPSSETRDEIGISAVAAENMPGVCYSYHVVRFRLDEDWDLNFRAYVFQSSDFRRQAYRLGDGSGQRYVISQDNFRNMTVRVPGKAEQERIGATLRAASDEIAWLTNYIDKLRTEKKALMQQLLTGKIRVKV
jgi:type I restriction enzyme S subunit